MALQYTSALVTLASVNFPKIVDFYTDFLGHKPTTYIPNVYAEFQLSGVRLGIFLPKKEHCHEFETPTKSKMSLCLEVSDLENAIARLSALGYPAPGEIIRASHGKEIYAYDPDGNRIILYQSN
jgi:catechol 2,3-dioxygenase-like lactoylglutathione lyase family enzyme